ncbi:MAG: fibronectin type III domain-containing protein [Candidatus Pristimantibacillus lignocellulolyticus]|uniref:Fibronectin type III domain-containing protein n=1 Tax=Candidatus Pristimantibacillus lignocellulolyticus TaxID=2994561 RepID=A0A9J6ZJX3_9BACL|nr:MAG: fibronectin type III domain-containing protein [Candidatus Pristimantibacillus lignocellulolyticus]
MYTRKNAHRPFGQLISVTLVLALIISMFLSTAPNASAAPLPADKKIIVGYWHNFDNGSGKIRLRDVSPDFDVINVSFAEPTNGPQGGTIGFAPYNATDNEFISDIQYLQSLGKKVIISIGGANGQVQLINDQARTNFVSSMKSIISKYGFNGLDIDFEGHSFYLNPGDSDFRNPTTPVITNVISAVRELHTSFGDDFMLTMAPETFFVQLGYSFYGGSCLSCDNRAGSYLPVIYGLLDILDWLQVQHYNSGPIKGLDGISYPMGNADFHVAMADMMLNGFPVAGNNNQMFPALRSDQVVIGLPANVNAGGGFTGVAEVQKALDYLMKGKSFGGSYQLQNGPHPGMRGLMTWSINWDKFNNFEFSSNHRTYLDQYSGGNGGGDTTAPTIPGNLRSTNVTTNSVSLAWNASTDNVGVTGYTVSFGNSTVNVSGTTATINGLAANTDYTFTVKARDAAGNLSNASNAVTVKTVLPPVDTIAPTVPTNLQVTGKSTSSVNLSWTASTDNVGVTGYTVSYGGTSVNVTGTNATINGLSAGTTYTFTVTAKDAAGNLSAAATVQATTDSSGGNGNTCTEATWNASSVYTGGQRISYNGKVYEAKWWTQGDRPDLSGSSGVWKYISDCSGSGGGNDMTAPTAPSNLQVTNKSTSSVSLSWTASTDATGVTGYTVSYGSTSVNVTGTSATLNNLSAGTTYTFTVTAKDASGNVSAGTSIQAATDSASSGGDATAWVAGISYKTDDEVTYGGSTYICRQNHTSLLGWEPSNVPALWKLK